MMTTTQIDSAAWQRDARELEIVLLAAASERESRQDFDDTTGELEWVIFERGVMRDAVNRLRARLGAPPVTAERVALVERTACGHIDYVKKYALRFADLVHQTGGA